MKCNLKGPYKPSFHQRWQIRDCKAIEGRGPSGYKYVVNKAGLMCQFCAFGCKNNGIKYTVQTVHTHLYSTVCNKVFFYK